MQREWFELFVLLRYSPRGTAWYHGGWKLKPASDIRV
jgi:hypothetical protein